jgi:hypothetical protein
MNVNLEASHKKKHIAPDARRKDRISTDKGHRKDVKKGGAGSYAIGKKVSGGPASLCNRPLSHRAANFLPAREPASARDRVTSTSTVCPSSTRAIPTTTHQTRLYALRTRLRTRAYTYCCALAPPSHAPPFARASRHAAPLTRIHRPAPLPPPPRRPARPSRSLTTQGSSYDQWTTPVVVQCCYTTSSREGGECASA